MAIITTTDLAQHLNIADNDDDSSLAIAVDSVNEQVGNVCGELREFVRTEIVGASARVFRADYDRQICFVNDFWETSALVVKTDDSGDGSYTTTWVLNTDYILEPLNGRRSGQAWPYEKIVPTGTRIFPYPLYNRPAVQVTAAWGWPAPPASVKQGALIEAAKIYRRRYSPDGVLGASSDFGAVRVSNKLDPDYMDLVTYYRRAPARVRLGVMDSEAVRVGLAAKLTALGIRTDAYELELVNPPSARILEADDFVDYDLVLQAGADELHYKIVLYVSRGSVRTAVKALDAYRSRDTGTSVKQALETVASSDPWDYVTVTSVSRAQQYVVGDMSFIGCEFSLEVVA